MLTRKKKKKKADTYQATTNQKKAVVAIIIEGKSEFSTKNFKWKRASLSLLKVKVLKEVIKHVGDNSYSISINQKLRNKRNGQKQNSVKIISLSVF